MLLVLRSFKVENPDILVLVQGSEVVLFGGPNFGFEALILLNDLDMVENFEGIYVI